MLTITPQTLPFQMSRKRSKSKRDSGGVSKRSRKERQQEAEMTNRMDEDEGNGYTWESAYAEGLNIGNVLQEDDKGSVEKSIAKAIFEAKRNRRLTDRPSDVRLGIMRNVFLVFDVSKTMAEKAMLPSRLNIALKVLDNYVSKFFEQNPISQLGIILVKDRKAEKFVNLTGNQRLLKEALASLTEAGCEGEFSLQNGLKLAYNNLKDFPNHCSKEILVVASSITTCDPTDILELFEAIKKDSIKCSVVHMTGEMYVCKRLCAMTGGRHDVILDQSHFDLILTDHVHPPKVNKELDSNLIRMGFPPHQVVTRAMFCACHKNQLAELRSAGRGYLCPQCHSRYCQIPVECKTCKLVLVSAPQLARASQHFRPLPAFSEVETPNGKCFACSRDLDARSFACKRCSTVVCVDCDILLHESMGICPGCPVVTHG
ncbi:hypothetical protein L596_017836 [Steinernema carpocapsae]|uniref:General transcription factor IIH subunit n=2 Tax=Steinernema carpocapsae TaxID=34508 RepID=A0A4U5N2U4_STECR|nr:hypothetical protein L596_017836 [Steinernema carpocapsae]